MQTTENIAATHVLVHGHYLSAEEKSEAEHDRKTEADAVDAFQIIMTLIAEEKDLRHMSQELEQQAQRLDDGDDEAHMEASHLRVKSSEQHALANKISCITAQMDPKKKISHSKLEKLVTLQAYVSGALYESEHATESSIVVHATSDDHKEAIRHHAITSESHTTHKTPPSIIHYHSPALPAKKSAATAKKPVIAPPKPQPVKPTWHMPMAMVTPVAPVMWWPPPVQTTAPATWSWFGPCAAHAPNSGADHSLASASMVMSGQVVAAVKNLTIAPSISALQNHDIRDSLAPVPFAIPSVQFLLRAANS